LWESNLIDLPKNLTSRELGIKVKVKKKIFFTPAELKRQVDEAVGQLKLHLLLMTNCGFYQSDIAELKQEEVDWTAGIITRKRSKTDDREETPTVRWKLWPITFELLKKHRSAHLELALLTNRGKPWVEKSLRETDGKLSKTDKIVSNYRRLIERTGIVKPLKTIRKTSANLLESHKDHARFADYFLGHAATSIKDKHYTDVPDDLFFAALDWLREQYDL
jgi:integrase